MTLATGAGTRNEDDDDDGTRTNDDGMIRSRPEVDAAQEHDEVERMHDDDATEGDTATPTDAMVPTTTTAMIPPPQTTPRTTPAGQRHTQRGSDDSEPTTRNRCLRRRPTTTHEYKQLGLQLARAMARQDVTMVRKVADSWPVARATLDTTEGVTTIADLPALTKLIGLAIADPTQLTTRSDGTPAPTSRRAATVHHYPRSA